jgi:hypothetical protein
MQNKEFNKEVNVHEKCVNKRKYLPMFKGSQALEAWFFVQPARNLTLLTLPEATNYINLFSIDGRQWAIAEFE